MTWVSVLHHKGNNAKQIEMGEWLDEHCPDYHVWINAKGTKYRVGFR